MNADVKLDKKQVWITLAAGALANSRLVGANMVSLVSQVADGMVREWETRFGDVAFMLEGQSNCNACKRPLTEASEGRNSGDYVVSMDALKFCNDECMKAAYPEAKMWAEFKSL